MPLLRPEFIQEVWCFVSVPALSTGWSTRDIMLTFGVWLGTNAGNWNCQFLAIIKSPYSHITWSAYNNSGPVGGFLSDWHASSVRQNIGKKFRIVDLKNGIPNNQVLTVHSIRTFEGMKYGNEICTLYLVEYFSEVSSLYVVVDKHIVGFFMIEFFGSKEPVMHIMHDM